VLQSHNLPEAGNLSAGEKFLVKIPDRGKNEAAVGLTYSEEV
jgi:hypothetical protein